MLSYIWKVRRCVLIKKESEKKKQKDIYGKKARDILFVLFVFNSLLTYSTLRSNVAVFTLTYSSISFVGCLMLFFVIRKHLNEKKYTFFEANVLGVLSLTCGVLSIVMKTLILGGGLIGIILLELVGIFVVIYIAYNSVRNELTNKDTEHGRKLIPNMKMIYLFSLLGILVAGLVMSNWSQMDYTVYLVFCLLILYYLFGFAVAVSLFRRKFDNLFNSE